MKRLYFNIFAILLLVVSCQDTMEKSEKYPLAGKWVALDDHGSVSHYIEFKTGKYYKYESSEKLCCYYSDQTIWNPNGCSFNLVVEDWYSVSDGSLMIYDGQSFDVSTSPDGILKIGNQEYYPVKSFSSQYGFSLVLDAGLDEKNTIGYTATEQEIVWNYQMGLPAGNRVDVLESADWIELVQVTDTQVKLRLAENPSIENRSTPIVLSHPAVASLEVVLVQGVSGPVLASTTTSATYAGEVFEISYAIENLKESIDLIATTDVEWITDLSVKNGKLTFKVAENNSGSLRTGDIVLTYGSVTVIHKVTQSYSAPKITCNPISTSCDYAAASKSFTYTLNNPREGQSVKVTCSESWITNLVHEGMKVSFNIAENNSGSSRTGSIVLTYGAVTVNHKVEQMIKAVDLSSSETANCYIVSESGAYKFKTVKGNSTTSVGTVSSAVVLWESFGTSTPPNVGDLIKSVSYMDSYIFFQTADTFKEGNAVIAVKDADDNILWSWHIWLTDQPQGQDYYNNAGVMMDRNLGATSATPGDVGALGLLYQWGRKDPFLGSSSISSYEEAKSTITWPSAVSTNSSCGTVSYVTANPTTFVYASSSPYDWHYSSRDNSLWTTSESNKSIYDPCPEGWRVPDGGDNGVWSKAKGSSSSFSHTYNSSSEGMNFSGKFGSYQTIWYPAPGCRYSDVGSLGYVGERGFYWSASPDIYNAYGLFFSYIGSVYQSNDLYRAGGLSVRCLQE